MNAGDDMQTVPLNDRYQSSYSDRVSRTPSLETNRWSGERGDSLCVPKSDLSRQILEERGLAGISYKNGIPDFSPVSESTVQLGYMTDARHSRGLSDGRDAPDTVYAHFEDGKLASSYHYADKDSLADLHMKYDKPGNFEQADVLTAEQWTIEGRNGRKWTAGDVAQYRKDNGLTWHECNDMQTMQMVPEAINADFGHLGGVAEVKKTQQIVDEVLNAHDVTMLEDGDFDRMTGEELDAFSRENGRYDSEGVWMPGVPAEETSTDECVDVYSQCETGFDAWSDPSEGFAEGAPDTTNDEFSDREVDEGFLNAEDYTGFCDEDTELATEMEALCDLSDETADGKEDMKDHCGEISDDFSEEPSFNDGSPEDIVPAENDMPETTGNFDISDEAGICFSDPGSFEGADFSCDGGNWVSFDGGGSTIA